MIVNHWGDGGECPSPWIARATYLKEQRGWDSNQVEALRPGSKFHLKTDHGVAPFLIKRYSIEKHAFWSLTRKKYNEDARLALNGS